MIRQRAKLRDNDETKKVLKEEDYNVKIRVTEKGDEEKNRVSDIRDKREEEVHPP